MSTYQNVIQAPLDKMKTAADEWAELKGKLDTLAQDAQSTMAAKAGDDYWRGVNAEATKPFVDKTAKDFFSKEPTSYNQDGSVGGTVDLDPKKGDEQTNYLGFFANKDYTFFADVEGHNPDDLTKTMGYMPDALGHALESATLGHAWDDPTPELKRDETTAGIMKDAVDKYGGDAELLKKWQPTMPVSPSCPRPPRSARRPSSCRSRSTVVRVPWNSWPGRSSGTGRTSPSRTTRTRPRTRSTRARRPSTRPVGTVPSLRWSGSCSSTVTR
ncbi:hypothetical protein [Streptomyces sp. NRRL B-24572]|uniref:hypothetical protein n=1 Tax=Streptomyces sp. NRRL B-24572 TaxID=1962156 RepID=UPI0015C51DDA|nr:hypothetical protein [Streptomyces sp. NRRL B-24572]